MKYFSLLLLLAAAYSARAQRWEVSERAGGNLAWYGGPSASPTSFVNRSTQGGVYRGDAYTNSPYGSRAGLGLGLGLRAAHVGQRGGLLAFDLGYDWQRTRTDITNLSNVDYNGQTQTATFQEYAATGCTYLHAQNVDLFVGGGRRFTLGATRLDVLVGPEVAAIFGSRESGDGTYDNGRVWYTDTRRSPFGLDTRLRADVTAWLGRAGFNASYSQGFFNAQTGLVGAGPQSYGRVGRLGIAYQLN